MVLSVGKIEKWMGTKALFYPRTGPKNTILRKKSDKNRRHFKNYCTIGNINLLLLCTFELNSDLWIEVQIWRLLVRDPSLFLELSSGLVQSGKSLQTLSVGGTISSLRLIVANGVPPEHMEISREAVELARLLSSN